MSNDRNGETYALDVCASCKSVCCQDANPPTTQKRKKIIIDYLKMHNLPVENVFVQNGHLHPVTDSKGFCVFYNKDTYRCVVHPVKPETCKAGPITFDINLCTRKVEFYLKKSEICAFAGIIYEDKAQLKTHFEVAKEVIMQLIYDLEPEDLKDLLTIAEPQTFKLDEINLPKEIAKKLSLM